MKKKNSGLAPEAAVFLYQALCTLMEMGAVNPASIDMTGVGAYAAYLMGLEFIDEQSPV